MVLVRNKWGTKGPAHIIIKMLMIKALKKGNEVSDESKKKWDGTGKGRTGIFWGFQKMYKFFWLGQLFAELSASQRN